MYHRLAYRAPNRETVQTEGGFASCRWTVTGALAAIQAGCWFGDEGQHDFESGVGKFVREAQEIWLILRGDQNAITH